MSPCLGRVDARHEGIGYVRLFVIFCVLSLFLLLGTGEVFAAQESIGPNGCCWEQVYTDTSPPTGRLTGSADRVFYDWGYKPVEIYARQEVYWAPDCGWWYIDDSIGETVSISLKDANDEELESWNTIDTLKGRASRSYGWGADDDPGVWDVTVTGTRGSTTSSFWVYVRGQLNVSSVSFNTPTPDRGESVRITATLIDNANNPIENNQVDNNATNVGAGITVTAYVTGGGEYFEVDLVDDGTGADTGGGNDGNWSGDTPPFQSQGDHKVVVKATDNHQYWVDGRSTGPNMWISVGGTFPYASIGLQLMLDVFRGPVDRIWLWFIVAFLADLCIVVGTRRR